MFNYLMKVKIINCKNNWLISDSNATGYLKNGKIKKIYSKEIL